MELTGCYTYKFRISLPTPTHLGIVPRKARYHCGRARPAM
jgi:hypothetical protein